MPSTVLRLVVDFGLLVLIWMVQLIIYPSFLHYTQENLFVWHQKYTVRMGYIVAPLMAVQLGIHVYHVFYFKTPLSIVGLVLVIALWLITLLQFVPIHSSISNGSTDEILLKSLVNKNWSRTILWNLLFLIGLWSFVKGT
ncbi:MAG: hypothetical protein AAF575_05080 [Bacteroidota bacterium]